MAKKKTKPSSKPKKEAVNTLNLIKTDISAPVPEAKIVEVVVDTCWMVNFEEEITVPEPIGVYYEMLTFNETSIAAKFGERHYKMSICFNPVKPNEQGLLNSQSELNDSMTEMGVTLRFRVTEPQPYINNGIVAKVSKSDFDDAKKQFENGVDIFNNRFKLIVKDPLCGEKKLPIRFVSNWVKSNEHFGLYLRNEGDVAAVNKAEGIIIPARSKSTLFAHEFGHGFGLADEYEAQNRKSVRYIKPDGTQDEKIDALFRGRKENDPLATLYSCMTSKVLKPRHAWPIAIEVQKLLGKNINRKKGQEIKCDIEMI